MNNSVGTSDPAKMATFYAVFTLALFRAGRRKDAILAAEHTSKWLEPIDPTGYFLCNAYYFYSSACLGLWETCTKVDANTSKKRAKLSIKLFNRFKKNFPFARSWYLLVYGRLQWVTGKRRKAKESWKDALLLGQFHSNPYEQALALCESGRHSVGDERARNLQEAFKLLEKLESSYDIAVIKREMEYL
jgi:hypothetical protein